MSSLDEKVLYVDRVDDVFEITTSKGCHLSKTVIITTGMGAFTPKKLDNPSVEAFEGKGLLYFVQDLQTFAGKDVLVVGGGDSAADWTLALEPIARSVTLIHRRDRFRAHETTVQQILSNPKIKVYTFCELKALSGDEHVQQAVIVNNKTGEEQTVPADYCILALGFSPNSDAYASWGLETDSEGRIIARNFMMETSVPGIYTAGDIASYLGKVKLIATGFGEAANAVNATFTRVFPEAKLDPGHSSSRKDLQ